MSFLGNFTKNHIGYALAYVDNIRKSALLQKIKWYES